MNLNEILKKLYKHEINISISCFWDGGWDVKLGDDMNGFWAETNIDNIDDAYNWIIKNVKGKFPNLT